MVESTSARRGGESTDDEGASPVSVSRYDLVLATIPIAFLVALLAGELLSIPNELPLLTASVVGAVAVADGLFLNPPRRPRRPRSA